MEIFPYSWHTYEENNSIGIRVFGLNKNNESVFLLITDFTPYLYVELPETIDSKKISWTETTVQTLSRKMDEVCERFKPVQKTFQKKKKLYYAKKNQTESGDYIDIQYPFLKCAFGCLSDLKNFSFRIKKPIYIPGIGVINLKVHELDANPVLQFMCIKKIKPASWFSFKGEKITDEDEKASFCQHEYTAKYQTCKPVDKNTVAAPLIMGFDIEVNSTNPNIAPQSFVQGDKVFQISCVLCRNGEDEKTYEKYILSLNKSKEKIIDLIQPTVGEDVIIRLYQTESELLCGFTDLVCEKNPQILCGYNIFSFDIPYMYDRSKLTASIANFDQLSFIKGEHCKEKEINWSSSAYKNQHFKYLDAHGRLWVDMLPIIQRDYKLENYKLKTVSDHFLGQTKDPLTHKGIFKCYRMFTPESMSIVAKYCVKDSELVVKLFEKLQIWIGLTEMANTCNTPVFDLFTRGQQLKIYSQVYKKCLEDNVVIDKDSFIVNENDHFTGAYVFTPVPGLYDMVVSFDFSSLYPSTIIAYNIDYSTLVLDEKIPDEKCNIFEWEDHQNCSCPNTKVVKGKKNVVMCGKQRFRFLKEPAGVIPTLLRNLLDARKKTNNEMKALKAQLPGMVGEEKALTERLITVLDKRQLSYKVSANSMYGGMGVKKGYLPFLPGAMCTTARGRESIEKASKFLVSNYGAKLIYGDSVSADTPILVRYEDKTVDILRIDEIGEVWNPYEEFKSDEIDSNRKEKQQTLPFVSSGNFRIMNILEVWTGTEWSRVRRVIRHKTIKKMYRVLTHTGCVDVTEDHSLFDKDMNKIKPNQLSVGSEIYHSFPPREDFLEIEVKDAVIEGKVYECTTCGEHKLVFEFYKDKNDEIFKMCKECVFYKNRTKVERKTHNKEYVSETEYTRNPSKYLCEELAFVWGMFFAEGSCGSYKYENKSTKNSWAINNQNKELLEKCKTILEKCEPLFGWKILDTMKSSSVYKLVPQGHLEYIVNKWRRLFYDRDGHKKVPYFILNGSDSIKQTFFNGYYEGDGDKHTFNRISQYKFDIKGKIGAHGLYTLLYSLGHNVAINTKNNKDNIYTLHTCEKFRKNPIAVKKIINLPETKDDEYVYDIETEDGKFLGGIGQIIEKNTDSCYLSFPAYTTGEHTKDLDSFCRQVEDEISTLFPRPMKFAYEEAIYWRYLILTKKRYMALKCGLDGNVYPKIEKRGVLLSRRDNSAYSRDLYSKLIMKCFYKEKLDDVLFMIKNEISRAFMPISPSSVKDFVITKSIGDVKDYKIRPLPEDEKKLDKKLVEMQLNDKTANRDIIKKLFKLFTTEPEKFETLKSQYPIEFLIIKEYIKKSLPSQVQLAERMRRRGTRVDAGERLGYVVIESEENIKDKLFDKIEDVDYFKENLSFMKIDSLYYTKLMVNPIDEVLSAVFKKEKIFEHFYKFRINYWKVVKQLNELFSPQIKFLDEDQKEDVKKRVKVKEIKEKVKEKVKEKKKDALIIELDT